MQIKAKAKIEIIRLYAEGDSIPDSFILLCIAHSYVRTRLRADLESSRGNGLSMLKDNVWEELRRGGVVEEGASMFDPAPAIIAHRYYMRGLIRTFGGDEKKAIAAYSVGVGMVQRGGDNWEREIPREVYSLVKQVLLLRDFLTDFFGLLLMERGERQEYRQR